MLRLAAAAALFLGLAHPAGAQVFSGSMLHNLSSDDSKAINAAVQSALASARVGGATRWTGPGGRTGKAVLLSGGAVAKSDSGRVRITESKRDPKTREMKDWTLYTLNYRRQADGSWRAAG